MSFSSWVVHSCRSGFESLQTQFQNTYERTIQIKQITKKELQKLLDAGILRNSHNGFINERGYHVGYYKTSGCAHKRYVEDMYVNKARELL